jgi:ribosome-binding factor A
MSQRIERINELLRQEISKLILREIRFEDILVTVNQVETSADLSHAKVKINVIPNDKGELALEIIHKKIYHLQQELNKKLYLKIVPKIQFEIDQTEIKAQRIEEILGQIKKH